MCSRLLAGAGGENKAARGTTSRTLLVYYGLTRFLRHYLSNATNLTCCIIRHV